ncbi:MAG: hypothetical protein IJP54_01795, partial [Synergistaceae bacterium]|nr:hypothetical protein [Synergistaceae bacterium]
SIWAVGSIDEGIEILTGVSAGNLRKDNSYTDGSVHGLVKARLKKMLSDGMRLEKKFSRVPRKKKAAPKNAGSKDTAGA